MAADFTRISITSRSRPPRSPRNGETSGDPPAQTQTYAGPNGLGIQFAATKNVRPFRRLMSAQAIYRREVFAP